MRNVCTHGQKQRALRAGGQNHFPVRIHRHAGKGRQLGCQILAQAQAAAILRIGLRSALTIALVEQLDGARDRGMGVHVAMGEIHTRTFNATANEFG